MTRLPTVAVALMLLLGCCREASGRPRPPAWLAAQTLERQIQAATPKLSERERARFRSTFTELEAAHDRLDADEQRLLKRLLADRDDLKRQTEVEAVYAKDRAGWETKRDTHRAECRRRFTNPADVARCDEAGGTLAKERAALDLRQEALSKRGQELELKQAENSTAVAALEGEYAAWSTRVETGFSAPLRKALARTLGTTTVRFTVKSFIRVIDLASMSADSRPRAEQAFAWFTNGNFSENPATPSPDTKDYRLWSQAVVIVSCRGDTISSWKSSLLAHRGGKELRTLDTETSVLDPLAVTPAREGTDDLESLSLSYAIKGKPNDGALASFQVVKPRTCHNIWHRVQATVSCRDGRAQATTTVTGSRFPTHRAWTNGDATTTVAQGPFADLWNCDPSAQDRVR